MQFVATIVKASVRSDNTGSRLDFPVVVTNAGVLDSVVDYFNARAYARSVKWMYDVARAVKLFLEYLSSNPAERDNYRLFINFAQRLTKGTFDVRTGEDPSGLGWGPLARKRVSKTVRLLSDFFEYLSETRPGAAHFNPRYAGSAHDRMVDETAYQYRRDRAFLGHTWATSNDSVRSLGYLYRPGRNLHYETTEPLTFPDEHFERLITEGFRVGKRYDYRNILITVLLHCAGFRESEPFHLYVSDVMPDPANPRSALVLIHHPSEGTAPSDWSHGQVGGRKVKRREYLQQRWGLLPRDEQIGYHHAGWKGGAHEAEFGSTYFRAYWFAPWWGEFFLTVWYKYLEEIVCYPRNHPFAFVNTDREPRGGIYALSQFNKAHARAVRRIGLEVSKSAGTSPHGHRHAYGQRLRKADVSRELTRRFMHHSSIASQETYTVPSLATALNALKDAAERLEAAVAIKRPTFSDLEL
jgi:hypothetical protein